MARTGESYTTALRHVTAPGHVDQVARGESPVEHGGYRLRGGVHPVSAALANVLAHHGVRAGGAELTEALVFGAAGGPGAGYILWEFEHDGSRPVALGFSSQWQYVDRAPIAALERLGVPARVHRTGGAVGAARALGAGARRGSARARAGRTGRSPGTGTCLPRSTGWAGTSWSCTRVADGPTAWTTAGSRR